MKNQYNDSSRRKFIRHMAASGLGLAVTPYTLSGKNINIIIPKQKKRLGVALVGLGYYSTDLLAPALQETQNCYLSGIVTGTPEKAKAWQEKYGIKPANTYNYENFDEIASNDAIDIIYVVLPNSMHAEYTIRAAKAGKHVICEKPMALNVKECEAMIRACKDNDRMLSIGYRLHFEPHTQEVMRIAREKEFGPIRMVSAGAGYREGRADHWKVKKAMGGGAMMDMGVYSLQAARYGTGEEPVSVSAQTFVHRPDMFREVDETTMFQLEFPSGAVANLHTSFAMSMNYMHTTAENGWYKLDPFSAYRGIQAVTKNGPMEFPLINQQAAQMDEVAHGIMNRQPMRVPGEEGLRDIKIVEGIYASIKQGGKKIRLA